MALTQEVTVVRIKELKHSPLWRVLTFRLATALRRAFTKLFSAIVPFGFPFPLFFFDARISITKDR